MIGALFLSPASTPNMESPPTCMSDFAYRPIATSSLKFGDARLSALYDQIDATRAAQVRAFGMLLPLPVREQEDGCYQLLAGYDYLPALRLLGVQEVDCQVLAVDTPPSRLYPLQILHGLSTLGTSPILQAILLDQAKQHLNTEGLLRLLPLMGHKAHPHKIEELTALLRLQPAVLCALHRGTVAAKNVKFFDRLPDEEQQSLVDLITRFRAGGSKQQKLVEMLIELRLRQNQSIQSLLQSWLSEQPADSDNLPQQLHNLLNHLHERYAPHTTEAETNFQRLVRELKPPVQLRLNHCPAFEDESLEVTIRFANQTELRQHWPALLDLSKSSQ